MANFEHLHPSTIALLDLPDDKRKDRCRLKRWIPYSSARVAYERMEELFTDPRQQRPENLLLLAPTGNGKSFVLERFRANHPPSDNPDGEAAAVPVLHTEVPEEPTLDALRVAILKKLCAPTNPRNNRADRRAEVFEVLSRVGVKVLLVDELHNLLFASTLEREKTLAFLRAIGNELRVNVVAAGIQDARRILQSDAQLLNRFEISRLPIWRDGEDFRVLLASFEALLPLKLPSFLGEDDELARFLLTKSDGIIAELSKLLRRAAVHAIDTGAEAITLKGLKALGFQSPSERKEVIADLD